MIMLFALISETMESIELTLRLGEDLLLPLFSWTDRFRLRTVPATAMLTESRHSDQDNHTNFGVGIKSLLTESQTPEPATQLAYPAPLYLISAIDAELCRPHELEPLRETVAWMRRFLAKPHPELGRTGPVCPFVPISMSIDTIYLCVPEITGESGPAEVEAVVSRFRDIFLGLHPMDGDDAINKSLLMVFPQVQLADAGRLIDEVQQRLKPRFTRYGLMLGEFHNLNETPGLRNPAFRPLRSPLCMLVIRHMVESDLPFLERSDDPPGARVGFLRSYLRRLGGKVSERKLDMAIDALIDAEIELRGTIAAAPAEVPAVTPTAEPAAAEAEPAVEAAASGGKCPVPH